MSTIHPGSPRDDAGESAFTVEDAGSTTDAADLVGGERARQGDAAFAGAGGGGGDVRDRRAATGDDAGTRVTSTEPLGGHDSSGGAHVATAADTTRTREDDAGARSFDDGTTETRSFDDGSGPRSGAGSADAGRGGLADIDDDGSIAHVFDQTNGVIEGVEGESDGSAAGDGLSRAERDDENPDFFRDADVRRAETDDSRVTGS